MSGLAKGSHHDSVVVFNLGLERPGLSGWKGVDLAQHLAWLIDPDGNLQKLQLIRLCERC